MLVGPPQGGKYPEGASNVSNKEAPRQSEGLMEELGAKDSNHYRLIQMRSNLFP